MARWLFKDQSGTEFEEDLGDQRITDYLSAHGDLSPVKRIGDAPTVAAPKYTKPGGGQQGPGSEQYGDQGATTPTAPPKYVAGAEQFGEMGGGQFAQTAKDVALGPFEQAKSTPGPLESTGSEGGPSEGGGLDTEEFGEITLPTLDSGDAMGKQYIEGVGWVDMGSGYSDLDVFQAELSKVDRQLAQNRFQEDLRLNEERQAFELERFKLDAELARARDARDAAAQNQDKVAFEAAQRQILGIERERQGIETSIETARALENARQFNEDLEERQSQREADTLRDTERYDLSRLDIEEQKKLNAEKYGFEKDFMTRSNELEDARIELETTRTDTQDTLNATIAENRNQANLAADLTDNAIAEGNWQLARDQWANQDSALELNRSLETQLQGTQHAFDREMLQWQKDVDALNRTYQQTQIEFQTEEFNTTVARNLRNFNEEVRQFNILHSAEQFTEDVRQFDIQAEDVDLERARLETQFNRQQGLEELKYAGELARDPGSFLQSANLQRGLPLGTPPEGLTNVAGVTGGAGSVQLPPALEALRTGAGDTGALMTPDTGLGTPSVQQIGQLGPDEQQALFGLIESLGISQEDFVRMIQQTAPSQQTNVLTAA